MREPPASFTAMCDAFHQDAVLVHGGSLQALAEASVGLVPRKFRAELAGYLNGLLERQDSSELRRILRRQPHVVLAMSRDNWWSLFELIRTRLSV